MLYSVNRPQHAISRRISHTAQYSTVGTLRDQKAENSVLPVLYCAVHVLPGILFKRVGWVGGLKSN